MANVIPRYEPKENIKSTQTAVRVEGEAAAYFGTTQKLIGTMERVRADLKKSADTMKASKAQSIFNHGYVNIETDLLKDQESDNEQEYYERISKLKEDSLQGIDDAQLAQKLSIEFDKNGMILRAKVDADKYGKRLEENKVFLDVTRKALIDRRVAAAGNPNLQADIDQEWFELIDDNVNDGNITWEFSLKMMDKYWEGVIDQEIIRDPAQALTDLQKKSGPYSHLSTETKTEMAAKATKQLETNQKVREKAEKQAEKDLVVIQQTNEAQFAINLGKKAITKMSPEEVESSILSMNQLRAAGLVRPWFADAYTRMMQSPKVFNKLRKEGKKKERYKNLARYAQDIFNYENPDLQKKALVGLMDQAGKGETAVNEVGTILSVAYQLGAVNDVNDIAVDPEVSTGEAVLATMPLVYVAIRAFSDDPKYYNRAIKARMNEDNMTADFFKGLVTGNTSVDAAMREAERAEQIYQQTDRAKYPVGYAVETPSGIQYIWGFFPNGEADVYPERPSPAQLKDLQEKYP